MKTKKKTILNIIVFAAVALAIMAFLLFRFGNYRQQREKAQLLTLVNSENPSPGMIAEEYTLLDNGQIVDSRCTGDLYLMMNDCRQAGCAPYIISSLRSPEEQQEELDSKTEQLMAEKELSREEAEVLALRYVSMPGYSEHELGLSLDIVDERYQVTDIKQSYTRTQQWLMENCWRYGFILRYPKGGEESTGMAFQPWHYRYVGREASEQIHELGVTLEEYIELFYK